MLQRAVQSAILRDLGQFPVVGIIGPRQAGKTTLAKAVRQVLSPRVESLYLDLELDSDRRKLEDAESYLRQHQSKCILIDEVQRNPELFALLRALVDQDRRPGRFILLGSASPEIMKRSSESLAGRIAYTELTPFSLLESAGTVSQEHHWLWGGFPPAMLAQDAAHATRWLRSFLETFVNRDLAELGHAVAPQTLSRLLEMVASRHGQILNQSDLARSVGVTQPTIHRYLDLLEGGFVIQRLQPYFANISKRLVKQPKGYIRDSGIYHALRRIESLEQLLGDAAVGASWEGYVVEQIRRVAGAAARYFFYRTHKGAECDLVLETSKGICCIEIKRSAAAPVPRGFYEVLQDLSPKRSFIIHPSGEAYASKHSTEIVPLDLFLRERVPAIL